MMAYSPVESIFGEVFKQSLGHGELVLRHIREQATVLCTDAAIARYNLHELHWWVDELESERPAMASTGEDFQFYVRRPTSWIALLLVIRLLAADCRLVAFACHVVQGKKVVCLQPNGLLIISTLHVK